MEEITFYNFYSQIRSFVKQLRKKPMEAKPGSTLKKLGLTKDRLIKILLKRNIITRKESVKDKTDGLQGDAKYVVQYGIKEKASSRFEREVHKLYGAYVEKNVPKKQLNEEGEGGAAGGDGGAVGGEGTADIAGATNAESSGQFIQPLGKQPLRRKIYVSEAQLKMLMEVFAIPNRADEVLTEEEATGASTTFGVGDYTYDKPISDGHKNSFWGPALKRKNGKGGSTSIPKEKA